MIQSGKSLKKLLQTWQTAVLGTDRPQPPVYDGPDVVLTRLTEKTGEVDSGACFVARVRETSDGHPYIGQAVANGAKLILGQRPQESLDVRLPDDVVYIQVADTALALAWLAAAWYDFPSRQMVVIGVTGTDGKTSTASILFSILRAAGFKAGLLSTIKAIIGDTEEPLALHVTTPEAREVQRHLRRMVDAGLTHCIVEATSHGLAQHRVGAIEFDMAIVTNITHEHLDYHGDYEHYFRAKARLFEYLSLDPLQIMTRNKYKQQVVRTAVLNKDDVSYDRLAALTAAKHLTYGLQSECDVFASNLDFGIDATRFDLHFGNSGPDGSVTIASPLAGEFNVYNMLGAAAAGLGLGLQVDEVKSGIQATRSISGRMQRIDRGQLFLVLVDFAHTPNALENAIKAARRMTTGRIITVFGSAGKRDVEKRRLMAQVSARYADISILTAEDPRTESLDDILEMMADGCKQVGAQEGRDFWRIKDRGQAIYYALTISRKNDTLLICGKGHEQSMCFGTTEFTWDDREATKIALDRFLQKEPMVDLGLPTFHQS